MSEGHQLDGLTLLQDAAGGAEACEVFVNQLSRNVADLLIGETLDGVHQNALINEERISGHILKLLVREVGLTVRNEIGYFVLPGHSEHDEVQQVLAAVADAAGLEAVAVADETPLKASPVTRSTT